MNKKDPKKWKCIIFFLQTFRYWGKTQTGYGKTSVFIFEMFGIAFCLTAWVFFLLHLSSKPNFNSFTPHCKVTNSFKHNRKRYMKNPWRGVGFGCKNSILLCASPHRELCVTRLVCCGCKCHFPEVRLEVESHFDSSWHRITAFKCFCLPSCAGIGWNTQFWRAEVTLHWDSKRSPVLAFQLPSLSPAFLSR